MKPRKIPTNILDCRACELEIQGKEDLLTVTKIRQNPSRIDMLIVDYKWYTGIKESRSIWKATGIGVQPTGDFLDHTFIVIPKRAKPGNSKIEPTELLPEELSSIQKEEWADHVEQSTKRSESSILGMSMRYRGI